MNTNKTSVKLDRPFSMQPVDKNMPKKQMEMKCLFFKLHQLFLLANVTLEDIYFKSVLHVEFRHYFNTVFRSY